MFHLIERSSQCENVSMELAKSAALQKLIFIRRNQNDSRYRGVFCYLHVIIGAKRTYPRRSAIRFLRQCVFSFCGIALVPRSWPTFYCGSNSALTEKEHEGAAFTQRRANGEDGRAKCECVGTSARFCRRDNKWNNKC